ncbi:Protein of uncharacterised function (DUF3158) [Delftia tsuruhatensis]|uniref:DUF3158 family protein n=1 Tax=Delftia tsuruhatensis TaxID=180282 RepID=UPI001E750FBC|nr:DUF3158 family protein [Delftia tsuruhatensis]CAB5670116.1 Protein of uncharacterised function (DUF3158) [Delftia tsuruhatensis]CAC9682946.1 Protein of uncharacterised function (DUF3158) [Delftia tsuruhatensis]
MNDAPTPRYVPALEHTDFLRLEHAASLKGLLKPFKGKGALEEWAKQCHLLRDQLITLARLRVLARARSSPFHLLPLEMTQQKTAAGTLFLRWRKHDRSAMGVALWQELMASPCLPANLLADLLALEQQRVLLNMQISLLHTLGRQAQECADKMGRAEDTYLRQIHRSTNTRAK